jgi:hypothetical protein
VASARLSRAFASPAVGAVDDNPPIEPARSQQRWIEHVRTVGRRDEDHTLVRLESVHFDEELIEGLLPFIVPATEPGPSVPADGVDLIDEHDAGCVLLALLEQVADAGCPDAYNISTKSEPLIEKNGTTVSFRPLLVPRKGRILACIAFLSTAAPRRGILPDLEQQPSPKLFL